MSIPFLEHRYQVRVYDASDNVVAVYDDLTSIYYKKSVNSIGMAILTIPEGHDLLNYAVDDTLIQVWVSYRKLPVLAQQWGQTWVSDFSGLFRDRQIATDGDGNVYHLLYVPGLMEILSRYVSGYPAGTNNKSQWTGQRLSVICNDVVDWNCTTNATVANGRIRNATVIRGLVANGAIAGTPTVNYSVGPGRNILEFMQELAPICGFDFDVIVHTTPGQLRAKQYADQLGSDLSASVIFDLSLDNLASANLNFDGLREKTVAIVGGHGDGSTRTFVVATGANYAATNDYEMFVDARDKADTELDNIGDARIAEQEARLQLGANVTSSLGWVYRRDFSHGDLVTVQFAGFSATKKIGTTEVKFDQDQQCTIALELIEP